LTWYRVFLIVKSLYIRSIFPLQSAYEQIRYSVMSAGVTVSTTPINTRSLKQMRGIGSYAYSYPAYFGTKNKEKSDKTSTKEQKPYDQLPQEPNKKSESLAERYLTQELSKQALYTSETYTQQPKPLQEPNVGSTYKVGGPIRIDKNNEWWQSYTLHKYLGNGQWATSAGGERIDPKRPS
jgi:hypothetical protein